MKSFACFHREWYCVKEDAPDDLGLSFGIEIRPGDLPCELMRKGKTIVQYYAGGDPLVFLPHLGAEFLREFPGRAFWIEVGNDTSWYQLYEHAPKSESPKSETLNPHIPCE
jgi:hypothetical protein